MAKKEKVWMIWDCMTGSVDGYYSDKKLAEHVLNGLREEGCTSIMLCGIENKELNHGIPNHLWHSSNGVGFFGRGVGNRGEIRNTGTDDRPSTTPLPLTVQLDLFDEA